MDDPVRALVTRPVEDADALCRHLVDLDIEPVREPLLTIAPCAGHSLDLAGIQAMLLTSRNGVRALAQTYPARDIAVFAVGDATAETARVAGFGDVRSAGGSSKDLERLVGSQLDPNAGRLVHIAGKTVAGDLAAGLRAKGFTVDREVLYKVMPANELSTSTSTMITQRRLAMALFFSPRTAATFSSLAHHAGLEAACSTVHAVFISQAAEREARNLDWRRTWCAARPDMAAFIEAVAAAKQAMHSTGDGNG